MPTATAQRSGSMLDQLLLELQQRGYGGTKATQMPPVGPYMHGPDGMWSYPGLERPVISTRVQPRGLAGMLPARANNSMNPLYPYLTGFVDGSGSNPNATCDDCPTPGPMKNCFQTATFGRYCYQTRTIDITRMGQIINRGEFTDLMLWNQPLTDTGGLTTPGSADMNINLNNEASIRFAEIGVAFQNKLMKQVWDGNPTNNSAQGGYKEFTGLDILIGTGKRDAVTGQTCPSLDSLMVAYNAAVDATGANNIVNTLTYTMRSLMSLASRTGLDPVRWAIVMREELFYEITAQWPCNYLTYRCVTMNSGVANLDVGDAIAMRDAMRQGSYLVIDGKRVDVILDDAIDATGTTTFTSDIVILPLTVQGNKAVTFWEYFAWNGPNAALAAETLRAAPLMSNYYWTDGGQYIWHLKPPVNWCVQWIGAIEPRVILLTPHLAARITGVQYTPLMTPRQPFSTDPKYVNGGVTSRTTAPSFYRMVPASEEGGSAPSA